MKRIFSLLLVMLSLFTLGACKSEKGHDLREVRVNEVTHSVFYAPFYAAIELGYFEEEGILISLTNGGGSDKSMTALLTGSADVGLMGPETAVYVANEGRDDHAIIFAQLTQRDGSFLMGKEPDSDFEWEKLKGTSVIGGRSGGMPQMTLDYVLRQNGLYPGENITVRTDVQFDLMGGAFIAGDDDYVTMFEPSASAMEMAGEGYIVASIGEEGGEIPYTCFMAARSVLEKDPDFIEAFTRAIYRGQRWVETTAASEIASVIAPQFPDSDTNLLTVVVERYRDIGAWKTEPEMSKTAYENLIGIICAAGVIEDAPDFSVIVNNDFANAVK